MMQTERCKQCGQSYLRESGVRSRTRTGFYCSAYCLKQAEGPDTSESSPPPGAFSATPTRSLTPWVLGALLLLGLGLGIRWLQAPPSHVSEAPDPPLARKIRSTDPQARTAEPETINSSPISLQSAPPTAIMQRLQAAELLESSNPAEARREVSAILSEAPMPEAYALLFRLQLQAGETGPALTSAQNCLQLATELSAQARCHQLFVTAYTQEAGSSESQTLSRNLLKHLDALMAIENRGDLYLLKARVLCPDEPEAARSNLDAGCAAGLGEACSLRCIDGQVRDPQLTSPDPESEPDDEKP